MSPNWRLFNEEWMNNFVGPIYVVFYDKLKTDLKGEMRRLMKFLDHVKYKETYFYGVLQQFEDSSHRNSTKKVEHSTIFLIRTVIHNRRRYSTH